jgi:superfamily II DNA or RNA helicase
MPHCNIIIKDEVNVKLDGLDLVTRRKLTNKFKYEIPGARFMPAVKLGRWDGTVSFFSQGGLTYVNLLEEIVPILEDNNYTFDLDDRRQAWDLKFEPVKEDTFSHVTWPKGHTMEGQPIVLRDHQVEVINNFINNPQCLQEVATAAGKTIITAALSKLIEPYGRSIIIVPNKSLVTQTEEDYINMGLDVGVYFGDRKEPGRTHTICTWQSLNILEKKRQNAEDDLIEEFKRDVVCVIVDEVHQAKADVLRRLLTNVYGYVPIRWGLTGTVPKADYEFKSLHVSLGDVINRVSAAELQAKGLLAKCQIEILQLWDYVDYKNYREEQTHLVTKQERINYIGRMVEQMRQSGNTLVLVDRVKSGELLTEAIPDSVFVRGATKADKRKEHYDDVKTADDKVIVATYGVAAVGINLPRIFNLVLIEPGKSFVRVIQSIGRGIRKAQDKDFVQVWDVCSTAKFSKRHLTERKKFYREAQYPFTVTKVDYQK